MATYAKVFQSMLRSTVWQAPATARCVWFTLMLLADRDGIVEASIPGLARESNVSLEDCEKALKLFLAPDRYSRTPDNDGRRIEVVRGGWRLMNYEYYRDLKSPDQVREQNAARQQRKRDRDSTGHAPSRSVTLGHAESPEVTPSGSGSGSDPLPLPPRGSDLGQTGARSNGNATWAPHDWLRHFGRLWAEKYGWVAYGDAGDPKGCSALGDVLAALPEAEKFASQAKAPEMIREFLSRTDARTVDRRHPFVFFVHEWGGLRVAKKASASSGSRGDATVRNIEAWLEKESAG